MESNEIEGAALRAAEDYIAARGPTATTHGEWAALFLEAFAGRLVADQGAFWSFDPESRLHTELSLNHAAVWIGEQWNGPRCHSAGDYRSIVGLAYDALTRDRPAPFMAAPYGVVAGDLFYRIVDGAIVDEPLKQEHFARFKLPCGPDPDHRSPNFDKLLDASFPLSDPDSAEQRDLLAQHFGAVLFGTAWLSQKALLWFGPGSAGKSTFQKILRGLLPASLVSAVPPHLWDMEYHAAALAGKRLNLVGEVDDRKPLGAAFKTVTGNDLVQGRHPTHRPFSFVSEAAQLGNCNYLPPTTDRSEAFFRRWSIVAFKYVTRNAEQDELLAEKILESEMPRVLSFAFEGERSRMASGKAKYLTTKQHVSSLARWERQTNSVAEFLYDSEACELKAGAETDKTTMFEGYKHWCSENGRHAFGRNKFKEQMLLIGPRAGVEEGRDEKGNTRMWKGVEVKFPY